MNSATLSSVKRAFWILVVWLSLYLAIARVHTLHEPFERDITCYAYIAEQILNGQTLYVDVWDHKPPAIYFTYALFQALLGYGDTAIYALNVTFASLLVLLVGLVARQTAGASTAVAAMTLTALVSQNIFLQMNQPNTELPINVFKLLGVYFFFREIKQGKSSMSAHVTLSGLAVGISSLFKMVTVFTFAALLVMLVIHGRKESGRTAAHRALLFSAAAALPWVTVIGIYFASGNFDAFWDAVYTYNSAYASAGWEVLWPKLTNVGLMADHVVKGWKYELAVAAGIVGGVFLIARSKRSHLPLLALLAASAIEAVLPGWRQPHYYQLVVPFLILVATTAMWEIGRHAGPRTRVVLGSALFAAVAIPLIGDNVRFFRMSPEEISIEKYGPVFVQSRETGEFMRATFAPDSTVLELGDETGLHYYSRMITQNPFLFLSHLDVGSEAQRTKNTARFNERLTTAPPDLIIDTTLTANESLSVAPRVRNFLDGRYMLCAHREPFLIYCNNESARLK